MAKSLDLFTHGNLSTAVSPFLYKSTESPDHRNVETTVELGAVTPAVQWTAFATDEGSSDIQGVFPFETASSKKLFMVADGGLKEEVSGTWTGRVSSLDTTAKFESAMLYDTLYVTNGVDDMLYTTDGTTWNTVARTAKYLAVFRDRLYEANLSGTTENQFTYSDAGDGTTVSNTIATIEDAITGIHATFNYVYLFTANSFWRWDETYLLKVDNTGTRSHRTLASGNGLLFFANKDGVWMTDGGKAQLISRPVQYWIDGIATANLDDLNAAFYENEYYLWIGDSQTVSDVVLVYNTLYQQWRVLTGWNSLCMAVWTNSDGERNLYFGEDGNSVVRRVAAAYTQNGTAIDQQYLYPQIFPAGPDKEFFGKTLHCYAESTSPITFQLLYATDWSDDFQVLDTWTLEGKGFTEYRRLDVSRKINGRSVQWKVLVQNASALWKWQGMRFYFETSQGVQD